MRRTFRESSGPITSTVDPKADVPPITVPPGVEGIANLFELPDPDWKARWERIILPQATKDRLLNYMVFSLRHRGRLDPVALPVHGLVVLAGVAGTGKTTLAGGLADQAARVLDDSPLIFIDINPHVFPSQLLGESQRSVARLFERTLPDLASRGRPMVVLLDEVEALAVNRSRASLETNPVDVHRATDAVLSGIDRVARECPNVTFVATTNYPQGVDSAFLSRADLIEKFDVPGADAVAAILTDTLSELTGQAFAGDPELVALAGRMAAEGVDARQVRKLVLRTVAGDRSLALEPGSLTPADLAAAYVASAD